MVLEILIIISGGLGRARLEDYYFILTPPHFVILHPLPTNVEWQDIV